MPRSLQTRVQREKILEVSPCLVRRGRNGSVRWSSLLMQYIIIVIPPSEHTTRAELYVDFQFRGALEEHESVCTAATIHESTANRSCRVISSDAAMCRYCAGPSPFHFGAELTLRRSIWLRKDPEIPDGVERLVRKIRESQIMTRRRINILKVEYTSTYCKEAGQPSA